MTKLTERINYTQAGKYIKDIPQSLQESLGRNLGGTLSVSLFRKWVDTKNFAGIMAWFCLDENSNIFLAFERKVNFQYPDDPTAVPTLEPEPGDLLISSHQFGLHLPSIGDHGEFLRYYKSPPPPADRSLPSEKVKAYCDNFLRSLVIGSHQKYGFGYFQDDEKGEKLVKEFIKQDGIEYIRYYFGYHLETKPNYIRIVLVPVDKDGMNIPHRRDMQTLTLIDPPLIQKSVPPPPM